MNKAAIKSFAIEARKKLISEITYRAGLVGITKDGISDPIHKASGIEMYDIGGNEPYTIKGQEIAQRNSLASKVREQGFENVIEEIAYTWFNRIIAIRFMEVNDYLPTRVRVLSSENKDKIEPDIVTEAPNVDLEFTSTEIDEILQLKEDNKLDELFRLLFIKQSNALNDILPELFEKTSDYTELLLSISFTNEDSIVRKLVKSIDENDFREQVEIIGWMYQYYISERKEKVISIKNKGAVKKEDIPAATQLFTTDWIVRYMVDNSLGKLWIDNNPNSSLKDKLEFYLGDAEQVTEVQVQIKEQRNGKLEPENITLIDPCMGSGHILVYAFDIFVEIYKECGYDDREIPKLILTNNLYGIDIDRRAYQLAYFALMMKARSYSRRVLNQDIKPQICSIYEMTNIDGEFIEFISNDNLQIKEDLEYLRSIFSNSKELGSIIKVKSIDFDSIYNRMNEIMSSYSENLLEIGYKKIIQDELEHVIQQAFILSNSYDIVATNPPYLNKFDTVLKDYVSKNYKNYSSDLFSVFIYRNFDLCKPFGYSAFMTPFVWMFIRAYEKLRDYIINKKSISSLIQLEYSAFEEATVPICTFVLLNANLNYKGTYIKLSEFKGAEAQPKKTLEAIKCHDVDYRYDTLTHSFTRIQGMPIAYWASEKMLQLFNGNKTVESISDTRVGMHTGSNELFVREWYEVDVEKFMTNCTSHEETFLLENIRWYPYNKGGAFRRWYGNRSKVVDWQQGGARIHRFHNIPMEYNGAPVRAKKLQFKECITWSDITSGMFSSRYSPVGSMFDVKGSSMVVDKENIFYILGLLNSKFCSKCLEILNPTISFQVGNIKSIPLIIDQQYKDKINSYVAQNIEISKIDWDSFETSWDFDRHPFVTFNRGTLEKSFNQWSEFTREQFYKLKNNEEKLNFIFMQIYGLKEELNPEVEEKDVTIRRADLFTDMKSFISYAVGCMFGRYSLDNDGLVYAGGEWDDSKYKTFIPDEDNIIPITDDEYFTDDIVDRFVEFVKATYGEETIKENLTFIAKALGGKGDTSKEIIRNYFIKDFYKDHIKMYKKRPIYWMFDSGKENGFKALIYMHRYNEDTVALVRADYLHKVQKAIENAIESADIIIDSATSRTQKAKAVKQKEKLVKQLAETRNYDAAIAHVASKRIGIDLDDGVTVNYAKFQGVEVSREGKKAIKIDLLSKI